MKTENQTIGEKIKEAIGETLFNELQEQIEKIENSVPTTKNHYGQYMAILSHYGDEKKRIGLSNILLILGANRQGIIDALSVLK